MLDVHAAQRQILQLCPRMPVRQVALPDCLGLVLAESVHSPMDSPPFDKALMDGFAVLADDLRDGVAELDSVGERMAGQVSDIRLSSGETLQIMTGAPLPDGADAVVRVEDTQADGNRIRMQASNVSRGTNVMWRGTNLQQGEQILEAGRVLRAQDLAALAELGQARVAAFSRPCVAVLATGDELCEIDQPLGPGQIRNSNETMLAAQIERSGAVPRRLGIARDDPADLSAKIALGLTADVLLLSGGVSAGKLDLVPQVLKSSGVEQVFHKVRVKPGKPLWFGVLRRNPDDGDCLVFGLPGNPVSSLVCYELFVRPALRRLRGLARELPESVQATLQEEHIARGDRPTYHPARLQWKGREFQVDLTDWHGSADLQSTVHANAMAVFEPREAAYEAGQSVPVIPWEAMIGTD